MIEAEVKEKHLPQKAFMDRPLPCRHQWRIVENFYTEFSRNERSYVAYCVYCLKSKAVILTNKK